MFGRLFLPVYQSWLTSRAARKRLLAAGLPGGHWRDRWAVPSAVGVLVISVCIQGITAHAGSAAGEHSLLAKITTGEAAAQIVETAKTSPTRHAPHVAALGIGGIGGSVEEPEADVAGDRAFATALSPDTVGGGGTSDTEPTRTGPVDYTVASGDTVSLIAAKFGLGYKSILWSNGIDDHTLIKPGTVLKIPPVDGVLYTVKAGDNLTTVATKFNADLSGTLDVNRLPDPSAIHAGDVVTLVGGQPPAPVVVPTPSTTPRAVSPFFDVAPQPAPGGPRGNRVAGSGFLWPTPNHHINQYFRGYRHTGVDIEGDYSSPIYAAADGTVESVSFQRYGYGYHIIINHGGGRETLYGHASKIFVKQGQHVDRGQTIAMVGSTGRSTGTHLHFEIILNGIKVNPLSYL